MGEHTLLLPISEGNVVVTVYANRREREAESSTLIVFEVSLSAVQ